MNLCFFLTCPSANKIELRLIHLKVLSFPVLVALIKVLIVLLFSYPYFAPFTRAISEDLCAEGISCRTNESSVNISKQYA